MIAYVRVLHYWAEKVQLPVPGQPHCLAGSMKELWWVMEPLVLFMEEEVFVVTAPSNWTEVSLPRPTEPVPQDPHPSHSCSHSQNCWACPRGSLSVVHVESQSTEKTTAPITLPQDVMPLQLKSDHKPPCPPSGFVEIAQTLGDEPVESSQPFAITGIPPEEVIDPYEVLGSSVMVTWLIQHPTLGDVY